MVKHFSALDKSVFTFNVWDVYVELGEFLTRALHALVHWLQNLFGVLLHPSVGSQQTGCATRFETEGTSFKGFSADLIPHPSLGKLCLISTWWWLRSSAVFELNTFKHETQSFILPSAREDWTRLQHLTNIPSWLLHQIATGYKFNPYVSL